MSVSAKAGGLPRQGRPGQARETKSTAVVLQAVEQATNLPRVLARVVLEMWHGFPDCEPGCPIRIAPNMTAAAIGLQLLMAENFYIAPVDEAGQEVQCMLHTVTLTRIGFRTRTDPEGALRGAQGLAIAPLQIDLEERGGCDVDANVAALRHCRFYAAVPAKAPPPRLNSRA